MIQKVLVAEHGEAASGEEPAEDDSAEPDADEPPQVAQGRGRLMQRLLDNRVRTMAEEYRLGRNPEEIRPGECGCNEWWYQLR